MTDFENTKNDRRERVFQMLFSIDFNVDRDAETAFLSFFEEGDNVPENGFVRDTFIGAVNYVETADAMIETDSKNWKASRMSGVTRNILRLAIYEIMNTETPPKVVISEAVNLAKKFGDDAEPSFINGILNRIAKEENKL